MQTLFAQLQKDPDFLRHNQQRRLTFVDLGSGDGRFVFGAARLGLFRRCIGYEINPLLHAFASTRRLVQPKYWDTTSFALRDIWKVDLRDSNVVAVVSVCI